MISREIDEMFPEELRFGPPYKEDIRSSIPRIIMPGVAMCLTYALRDGVRPEAEDLMAFERELDIQARFLQPRMKRFMNDVILATEQTERDCESDNECFT